MSRSAHIIHHQRKLTEKSSVDKIIFIVAIASPLGTIPQIIDVFTTHNVKGLSLLTWFFYSLFPCIWIWYGFAHKDRAILINNIMWFAFSVTVLTGIVMFR